MPHASKFCCERAGQETCWKRRLHQPEGFQSSRSRGGTGALQQSTRTEQHQGRTRPLPAPGTTRGRASSPSRTAECHAVTGQQREGDSTWARPGTQTWDRRVGACPVPLHKQQFPRGTFKRAGSAEPRAAARTLWDAPRRAGRIPTPASPSRGRRGGGCGRDLSPSPRPTSARQLPSPPWESALRCASSSALRIRSRGLSKR